MGPMRIESDSGLAAMRQHRDDPKKIASAASDFEALLLTQMMKSAREAASVTSLDGEDGGSCDAVMDYAEQQFGAILARAGGLGIAKLVTLGLTPTDVNLSTADNQ